FWAHGRGHLRSYRRLASGVAWAAPASMESPRGRHLDGSGARLGQESHPGLSLLDERRGGLGVDQYPPDPECALLSPLHPDGVVYASPWQGSYAAHLDARGAELPR